MDTMLSDLVQDLRRDEGVQRSAYRDSLGYLTIGVGRLIDPRKGAGLSDGEIDFLLQNDIRASLEDIQLEPWYVACSSDEQRRALLNLRFQLGGHGLRSFGTFLKLCEQKKWAQAAEDLANTTYAHQVPDRAARIQKLLVTSSSPLPEQGTD